MTTLFAIQFLALLWNAALTLGVIGAVVHARHTRDAVAAAYAHPREASWAEVVAEFYRRAGSHPRIAAGVPITGEVYDQVVTYPRRGPSRPGRPRSCDHELAQVIDPLRAAIVITE